MRFLALGHLQGRLAISAMVLVLSLVGEVFRPANLAALSAASDPAERARSFALMRLAVNAGMSLGPSVGGFLAAHDYGWLFVAGRRHLPSSPPACSGLRLPGHGMPPRRPSTRRRVRAGSPRSGTCRCWRCWG